MGLWEQTHREEDTVPHKVVLNANEGTSFVNPVKGSLLVSLLFGGN
jgi:hypothetical protein